MDILRRPEDPPVPDCDSLLFVELLLIRWIPANVIYVGFFRNFLLMACFLGIGVGILWGRDPKRLQFSPFGPLLLGLVILVTQFRVTIQLGDPSEIFFGLSESTGADINFLVLPALVIIATVIMAGLAVPLGRLLTSMPPLKAYTIDIVGSMTGVALFTILSATGTPPIVWFAVVAVLAALDGPGYGARATIHRHGRSPGGGLLLVVITSMPSNQTWSPYYRIDEYDGRAASRRSTSTASRTRRCGRSTDRSIRSTSRSIAGSRIGRSSGC